MLQVSFMGSGTLEFQKEKGASAAGILLLLPSNLVMCPDLRSWNFGPCMHADRRSEGTNQSATLRAEVPLSQFGVEK